MNDGYPKAFACYNQDLSVRMQSTSGGIFTLLGSYVIEKLGGVVFGAAFDGDFSVQHICVKDVQGLGRLRGSKYAQSLIGNSYRETEQYLKSGTYVLFTGTPCQIAGLKCFLNNEYENLFCMDFVCHGVASDSVWCSYVQKLSCKGSIKNIVFKSKPKGWKKWYFKVEYNDHIYQIRGCMNEFMKSYLSYCNIRPSCYECEFKSLQRESDFTISDCWGIGEQNTQLNDDKGLSALLLQNERALEVFKEIKDYICFQQYEASELMAGNWTTVESVKPHPLREEFFHTVREQGGAEALNRYFKPSFRDWLWYYRMRLIGKEK